MFVAHSRFPAGHSGGDSRTEASGPGLDAGGAREHSTTGARFSLQEFSRGSKFTNRMGAFAEAEGHHPANNGWLSRKQNPKPRLGALRG